MDDMFVSLLSRSTVKHRQAHSSRLPVSERIWSDLPSCNVLLSVRGLVRWISRYLRFGHRGSVARSAEVRQPQRHLSPGLGNHWEMSIKSRNSRAESTSNRKLGLEHVGISCFARLFKFARCSKWCIRGWNSNSERKHMTWNQKGINFAAQHGFDSQARIGGWITSIISFMTQ